ncbi:MAG: signal peptidase I [Planctomycetota bacterium]
MPSEYRFGDRPESDPSNAEDSSSVEDHAVESRESVPYSDEWTAGESLPSGASSAEPSAARAGGSLYAFDDESSDDDSSEAAPKKKKNRAKNAFLEALVLVMTALLLALTLKTYVAEAYEIKGSSMLPTFSNGERVVVLKTFYDIQRGDIIIFSSVDDPSKDLIKRVVALPGEHVRIEYGRVFVDDVELDETYINEEDLDTSGLFGLIKDTVEPNHYYVLGDNRGDSHDSRRFSGVPVENIKGKVVARWWPLEDLRSF